MYDIDRERFGPFVAQLRKERGLTQRELAQRLYVSDKAVSKWERGAGMPDISMLMPLAEALGVTVSELLQAQRMEPEQTVSVQEAEALVQKAIGLTETDPRRGGPDRKKWGLIYAGCLFLAVLEIWIFARMDWLSDMFWSTNFVVPVLSAVFGAYFCLFAAQRLPWYYDEGKIGFVQDGIFRLNMPGIVFNNRNWPHVVVWLRTWCLLGMALSAPLFVLANLYSYVFGTLVNAWLVVFSLWVVSLLAALYIPAKKYE